MSKTTKALAILGVVAGLGVAALPFNAMAATDNNGVTIIDGTGTDTATEKYDGTADKSVSDKVTVKTTINDSISIKIVGDNDGDGETGQNHLVLLGTDGVLKNGENASAKALVTVATNNLKGYTVNMNGEATGFNGTTNTAEKFAPVTDDTATFPTTGDQSLVTKPPRKIPSLI